MLPLQMEIYIQTTRAREITGGIWMTHEHEPLYTGKVTEDGLYIYKCSCGKIFEIEVGDEGITTSPPPATHPDDDVKWVKQQQQLEKKKQESDYHKRRYQLMKAGQWLGTMPPQN